MTWDYDGLMLLVAVTAAGACALPGVFLVVRGMGLMGEAISHAVLPGIAVGYFISHSRESVWMFVGAAVAGVLAVMLTQVLHKVGRVDRGAAMGTVFTVFFSIGLILIVRGADHVGLDVHTVLYGAIELTPLNTFTLAGMNLPDAIMPLASVMAVSAVFISVCWKELKLACFDPELARTLGFNEQWIMQLVLVLVAATCVAAFEAVGSVMTVTFIVAPAATALLLSRRLWVVVLLAVGLGGVSAVGGHWAAITVPGWFMGVGADTSSSGMMAVVAFLLFVLCVLVAPRRGVLARHMALRRLAGEVAMEDTLGLLWRMQERGETADADRVMALLAGDVRVGPRRAPRMLQRLQYRGLAVLQAGGWKLTDAGRRDAAGLIRAHRLWETYLAARTQLPVSHVHTAAERLEHVTDPAMVDALAEATGAADTDPHGRSIPGDADA